MLGGGGDVIWRVGLLLAPGEELTCLGGLYTTYVVGDYLQSTSCLCACEARDVSVLNMIVIVLEIDL